MRSSAARPRVHIHLDHGRGPERWRRRWEQAEVFEEWPYGYQHAAPWVDLSYSSDAVETPAAALLRRATSGLLGFDLLHAWRNRQAIRRADAVWTNTEREHLAVSLLMRLGLLPHTLAVLGQTVWLWDRWPHLGSVRRFCYLRLLRFVRVHTTLSRVNAATGAAIMGRTVVALPYGTQPLDRQPRRGAPGLVRVLAPGNDRDRDWTLLLRLPERLAVASVTVLTRRVSGDRFADHGQITVRPADSVSDLIRCYRDADVVVVPLRPNQHASGITVALEAMNVGRPVVVADTGGLREYLQDHAWYYTPGDLDSLAAAVEAAHAASEEKLEAARARVADAGLTDRDYAARHALLTLASVVHAAAPAAVESFRPVQLSSPGPG